MIRAFLRNNLPLDFKDFVWSLVGGRGSLFWRRAMQRTRRLRTTLLPYSVPGRSWSSDIGFTAQWDHIGGALRQQWRGIPMLKHPLEMALYPALFWEVKPRTIIEIGSFAGGSAIWYSDTMAAYGLPCQILSIDVNVPHPPQIPKNVEFIKGDIANLGQVLTEDRLASLPRPLLVIEDASHQYEHSLAALRFFDHVLQSGEYIVVEDATTLLMGDDKRFNGGPARAISEFLEEARDRYDIDANYCDRFGWNVTGNPNGYLRRRS